MARAEIPFLDLASMHREIAADLDAAWRNVNLSGHFVGGGFVERFEAEWAAYCGVAHCVGVSDGTAAIMLALRALDIGAGDEVIVPVNTFIATWEAVAAVGATPIPVDVDPGTLLASLGGIAAACTPRTRAIIAVHLFGQTMDMDALRELGDRRGVVIIEDAAQAHGATWRGRRAGGFGAVGCFSFYPGKNLGALGDAGAIVTDRSDVAERIRSLANHGRHRDAAHRHVAVGGNHRLDSLQAAMLSAKLPHLDRWNASRRRVVEYYGAALADLDLEQVSIASGAVSSHHLAVVQLAARDNVRRALADEGIGTGIHYPIPCHQQPAFAEYASLSFPIAERAASRILSLPMSPNLEQQQVERVAAVIRRCVGVRSRQVFGLLPAVRQRQAVGGGVAGAPAVIAP
jgi:dTDP-4-amino-4,6-dideoxygalactose transaminase